MPKFNFIFSGDTRNDAVTICDYIDEYYFKLGEPTVEIDIGKIASVVSWMTQEFPSHLGSDKASPFKKAAAFTTVFVSARPIITPLPESFKDLATHQNAIVAFEMCVDALHLATINCTRRKTTLTLENRISISTHYWQELIAAFSDCIPLHHFKCVSMIYEALAYQTNPDIPYDHDGC